MAKFAALMGLACLVTLALALPSSDSGVVKNSLWAALKTESRVDIAVSLNAGVSKAYSQISGRHFETRGAKISSLRAALITNAEQSQKTVVDFLQTKGVSYETFWITNRIVIKSASFELIRELANNPLVKEIREAVNIKLEEINVKPITVTPMQETVQWGVKLVNADMLWENGTRGEGIVVANVDTGVRGTHRILKDNFLGPFGWYDPADKSATPNDSNGHGTHTMGTIAGQEGYGVAPGAKWMACVGCPAGSCPETALLDCAQFIFCPFNTNGQQPDCTKAPHLVSNSWGSTLGGQDWYDDGIKAWHAAGIIPIFSAGNSGPYCDTVGSPGDRDVIGVAAVDEDDSLAYFSSVGPGYNGEQKPEISAPGVDVMSSWMDGDSAFATISGTSMACPHVAGAVALLLQTNPALIKNYDGVRKVLFNGAQTTGLSGLGENCDGVSETTFPNYAFGYGRLDVFKSSTENAQRTHSKVH